MDAQRRTDLALETIEAFNRGDFERIRALQAPGFSYAEPATGRVVRGEQEFEALLRGWRDAVPDVRGEVTRVAVDGDVAVLEITWRGTHSGPLAMPDGTLPPSGRSVDFVSTLWQHWDGERMVEERHHLDMLTFLTQVGALPAPAPA